MDFILWYGVRDFNPWWGVRALITFLDLTLGVIVSHRFVQRAPCRCSRSSLLTIRAISLDMSELLAVVTPHLSWYPGCCHRGFSTGDFVDVAWPRESVDVQVSHH